MPRVTRPAGRGCAAAALLVALAAPAYAAEPATQPGTDPAPQPAAEPAGDSLAVPAAATPASTERPPRGLRMSAVEARYGAPTTRHAAVGTPPITRWDYPGFVVFFEQDVVVHAVTR